MPPQLVALTEGPSIVLGKPIVLVGRHPECDIQIESRKISRRHCCIAQVSDYLVVRDLGSTNGIRINGVRMLEGRVKAGDELTIGGYRYRVCWDEQQAAAARSEAAQSKMAPPAQAAPDMDELLESCDEPVPLADSQAPQQAAPKPLQPDFMGHGPMTVPPVPTVPPPVPPCYALPDEVKLAPQSEVNLPRPDRRSRRRS